MVTIPRKRGRPRKNTFVDAEVRQESAFPSIETLSDEPEIKISTDAKEKERIKEAVAGIPDIFSPEQVAWCFDAYVAILCFVYSIVLKTDFKALQKELEFSEEQKAIMAKPLARICSKYAPSTWAGMAAEIELITTLGIWTVSSFQRAKNVAVAETEKQKDANRTKPVAPIDRNRQEVHVPA
jgi:hypothetical protein